MTNVYVANEDGSITSTFHLILFDPHTDTIDTLTAKGDFKSAKSFLLYEL